MSNSRGGVTPPGRVRARRAARDWSIFIFLFLFLPLISSCPVIERNSLMRYKRKRGRSIVDHWHGADRLKSAHSRRSLGGESRRAAAAAAADKPILAGHVYARACDRIRKPCRTARPDLRPYASRCVSNARQATASRMTNARRRKFIQSVLLISSFAMQRIR